MDINMRVLVDNKVCVAVRAGMLSKVFPTQRLQAPFLNSIVMQRLFQLVAQTQEP